MTDLENKTIGDVIKDCVPEKFQGHFQRIEDGKPDLEWWSYGLELDDEDSIGTHVWNLLPETCEVLAWMPDASESFVETLWKAVADQCLTWVYG